MSCLLYCISCGHEHQESQTLKGVGDQPVYLVCGGGLSASISKVARLECIPDISRLLSYQKIVEWFHRRNTIIPMRYGCLFEKESQVIHYLEDNAQRYRLLLKEVDGCVEMGIRILLPLVPALPLSRPLHDSSTGFSVAGDPCSAAPADQPGRAYLAARRVQYEREAMLDREMSALMEQFNKAFAGLFTKSRLEIPPRGTFNNARRNPFISGYFLVPRRFVERFRKTFHSAKSTESAKFLLSGPWPPYNFVMSR